MYKYTEEELKTFHHGLVKVIAKELGVKSPTSKKKGELISLIMDIQEGKIEIQPKSNKGAKTKLKGWKTGKLPQNSELFSNKYFFSNWNGTTLTLFDSASSSNTKEFLGIFDMLSEDTGCLRDKNLKIIKGAVFSKEELKGLTFRVGDEVKLEMEVIDEKYKITKVISINGVKYSQYDERRYFDDLDAIYPNYKISFSNGIVKENVIIGYGQRALMIGGESTDLKDICVLRDSRNKVFKIYLDETPEEITELKDDNTAKVFYTSFAQSYSEQITLAECIMNIAKRYSEYGYNSIIMINGLDKLYNAYKAINESTALEKIKQYFATARCFEKYGSFTIIGMINEKTDLYTQILPFANCQIAIKNGTIDKENSYTKKKELIEY